MQRLKLRSRRNGNIVTSPFNTLLREAIAVTRKLDALRRFPACKLTAESYLAETLSADPNASIQGVKKLRASLAKKPPSLTHTSRTLARMILGLKGPNYPTPPTKYPGRLVTFSTPETTAELIRYGSSEVELFALAAQLVSESNPDLYGTCESSAEHAAQVDELEARQAELFKQIETRVSTEDLVIADDPRTPPAFKVAPTVPLAPRQDAGQRLVAYLMKQREQRS
jgi:hypothetical protein